jgi:hypothetical protein
MNTAKQVVAPRMQSLQKLEKSLKRLDLSWKVIETTARVVSPSEYVGFIGTLEHTRSAFSQLSSEMVEQIAQTHMTNCLHDLASRAQVAIDILVRNLFERTADVGFIATDAPLVGFVQAPTDRSRDQLQARLTEYRNKYTVYDDILVLDASAQILLALKFRSADQTEKPGWWSRALTQDGYVEEFGPSGLFRNAGNVLLYAHRISSPEGHACGAVVLKFDLQSELLSLFKALQTSKNCIVLLDENARVVACSDGSFGAMESVKLPDAAQSTGLMRHRGEEYLFAHCRTRGYQGYGGPGWTALAVARLAEAFNAEPDAAATGPGPAATAAAAATNENAIEIELNNAELHQIIGRARAIEEDLNRVIWNGKLHASSGSSNSALGPVFAEIGRTSQQTIAAFEDAILELKHLLLQGRRAELEAHAALAVDIMDRNLYERANDCRWWALSEEFASLLLTLEAGANDAAVRRAGEILAHLNSLYTVYRRVALFDRNGRILAVSRDPQTLADNGVIPAELLQKTLDLRGTQAYAVSAMQPHALADGEATYLYCAPIRKAGAERPIGGIALAFNCRDELQNMLQDSLPVGTAALGFFVDHSGRVLASTHADIAVGDTPDFLRDLQSGSAGAGPAYVCQWQKRDYLFGLALGKGYREFKTSDGYREDVRSVLLTAVDSAAHGHTHFALPQASPSSGSAQFGVVQCGTLLFALASTQVIESVSAANLDAPVAASNSAGLLKVELNGELAVLPVYDCCKLIGQTPMADPTRAVAVIVHGANGTLVLLVDRLVDVIVCDSLTAPPGGINPDAPWIIGYLHDKQAHTQPVFVLDPASFQLH